MRTLFLAVAFATLLGAAGPAAADRWDGFAAWQEAQFRDRGLRGDLTAPEARDAVQRGEHVPLREITRQIERTHPGRMVGMRLQRDPPVYVIDWVTNDGRKLTIEANAETGAIIRVRGG